MTDQVEVLAELIAAPVPAAVFDTGLVAQVVDTSHVLVDLGERSVTVFVPGTLAGAAGVGAFVRVSVQENSYVLDSVLSSGSAGLVPVGTVIFWFGSGTPPYPWLKLDGSTYSSTTYPLLYAHLGSTTLPDARDRFPRGASTSAAAKSTGGSETITEGQMPLHTHVISNIGIGGFPAGSGVSAYYPSGASSNTSSAGNDEDYWPRYLAIHWLIKAA